MTAALTTTETTTLAQCEQVIALGLETFVEVGRALLRIRDDRLYRAQYGTFEAYCDERWQISRPRAYQLIQAAEITDAVSTTVDTAPANEAQTRELARVPASQRAEVWAETVAETDGKPTAAAVRAVAERRTPPVTREEINELRVPPTPVRREPEPQGDPRVAAWLEADPTLAQASYVASFARTLARCDDFLQFDVDKIARLADDDLWQGLERLAASTARFVEAGRRARRGLRVIAGGVQ